MRRTRQRIKINKAHVIYRCKYDSIIAYSWCCLWWWIAVSGKYFREMVRGTAPRTLFSCEPHLADQPHCLSSEIPGKFRLSIVSTGSSWFYPWRIKIFLSIKSCALTHSLAIKGEVSKADKTTHFTAQILDHQVASAGLISKSNLVKQHFPRCFTTFFRLDTDRIV